VERGPLSGSRDSQQGRISRMRTHDGHEMQVALLTGGIDKPYAYGMAVALLSQDVSVDFIGSDELDMPELRAADKLRFLNLRGDQRRDASLAKKISRVVVYYARLIRYAATAKPAVFHILWNNKFETFDRTLLLLYYKLLGKKVALTAHNVNARKRDSNDSRLNRLTLRVQYKLADHIFVHTERMKNELLGDFGVREETTSVIPLGINNSVPDTALTAAQARERLGIAAGEKTLLFFGNIGPYKGLDCLVDAFQRVAAAAPGFRLIIAGKPKVGAEEYLATIQRAIRLSACRDQVIEHTRFIPDDQTELYFKAADVLVLPYTHVYQSGVLILGYSFGLPAIAADVGSFREDIVEGQTGLLFKPSDAESLATTIETYFSSDLYTALESRRQEIQEYAKARYSWATVGAVTRNVYARLLGSRSRRADTEASSAEAPVVHHPGGQHR
jgi:glycosyltransferase involved in cell wall biosynthesis